MYSGRNGISALSRKNVPYCVPYCFCWCIFCSLPYSILNPGFQFLMVYILLSNPILYPSLRFLLQPPISPAGAEFLCEAHMYYPVTAKRNS
jgi:hypothetical protein